MKSVEGSDRAYLVLRFSETIELEGPHGRIETKLFGCDGFCPVFRSKIEAEEWSNKGKYQIIPIEIRSLDETV